MSGLWAGHFCAQNSDYHPPGMQVAWHHQLGTGGLRDSWRAEGHRAQLAGAKKADGLLPSGNRRRDDQMSREEGSERPVLSPHWPGWWLLNCGSQEAP